MSNSTHIPTPIPARGYAARRLAAVADFHFVRTGQSSRDHIPVTGMSEQNATIALEVPVSNLAPAEADETSALVTIRSLLTLPDYETIPVLCTSLLFIEQGTNLVAPSPELGEIVLENLPIDHRIREYTRFNHPALSGEERVTFFCAAFLYHHLTGSPAVEIGEAITEDEIERRLSSRNGIVPVRARKSSVRADVAAVLDGILTGDTPRKTENLRSVLDTVDSFSALIDTALSDSDLRRIEELANLERDRRMRRYGRSSLLRVHGRKITLISIAVLLALLLPIQIITRKLSPPATAGMDPLQVATQFYNSWNDLDVETMEETLARKVGRDRIRQVSNLYVVDRVQQAYSRSSTITPAAEWIAEGKPDDALPFGTVDLNLSVLERTDSTARVLATYTQVYPDSAGDETTVTEEPVEEVLTLEKHGDYWEITAIEPH